MRTIGGAFAQRPVLVRGSRDEELHEKTKNDWKTKHNNFNDATPTKAFSVTSQPQRH